MRIRKHKINESNKILIERIITEKIKEVYPHYYSSLSVIETTIDITIDFLNKEKEK